MKDMFKSDCPYTGECDSEGLICNSCRHNRKRKKDHYEPYTTPHTRYFQPIYIDPEPLPVPPKRGEPIWCYYGVQK